MLTHKILTHSDVFNYGTSAIYLNNKKFIIFVNKYYKLHCLLPKEARVQVIEEDVDHHYSLRQQHIRTVDFEQRFHERRILHCLLLLLLILLLFFGLLLGSGRMLSVRSARHADVGAAATYVWIDCSHVALRVRRQRLCVLFCLFGCHLRAPLQHYLFPLLLEQTSVVVGGLLLSQKPQVRRLQSLPEATNHQSAYKNYGFVRYVRELIYEYSNFNN